MDDRHHGSTRRQFLGSVGLGALGVAGAGGLLRAAGATWPGGEQAANAATPIKMALAATDGHIVLPNRPGGKPLYIFGFTSVPVGSTPSALISAYKGKAQHPAPILGFPQENDVEITLTNLGLVARPDLADAHTIHWHGFRTPVALMDGVPEVSISVPLQKQFTYFYRPHNPGTYMYHCHFEDVEHVQMGMTGIVFVRPLEGAHRAYNDGNGSTSFDREFALLLNELYTIGHDHGELIQETIWTDYDPDYFTINGRVYPHTTLPNDSTALPPAQRLLNGDGFPGQPISALVQCNPGERVLLRMANLGYLQHAMQAPGLQFKVVGEDATLLRGRPPGNADLSYVTSTLYLGPGEARDALFTAPAFSSLLPTATDGAGTYNAYLLRNRDARKLSNGGAPGLGGMATEVRVYQGSPLGAQTVPNQTYPL